MCLYDKHGIFGCCLYYILQPNKITHKQIGVTQQTVDSQKQKYTDSYIDIYTLRAEHSGAHRFQAPWRQIRISIFNTDRGKGQCLGFSLTKMSTEIVYLDDFIKMQRGIKSSATSKPYLGLFFTFLDIHLGSQNVWILLGNSVTLNEKI